MTAICIGNAHIDMTVIYIGNAHVDMKKHSFTLCIVGLLTSSDSNRSSFYFITKLRKHRQNHKLFHCIAELIYRFFTN
jgi:hypothetical protein